MNHRAAILRLFFVCGLASACWLPVLPAMQEELGLSSRSLGLIVSCRSLGGAVFALLLSLRRGASLSKPKRWAAIVTLPLLVGALGFSDSATALTLTLLFLGGFLAVVGVLMNADASSYENTSLAPLLGKGNAMYGLGLLVGSFAGGWALSLFGSRQWASVVLGLGLLSTLPMLVPESAEVPSRTTPPPKISGHRVDRSPWLPILLALAVGNTLVDSAVAAWGPALMKTLHPAQPALFGLPYAMLGLGLFAGRLMLDRIQLPRPMMRVLHLGSFVTVIFVTLGCAEVPLALRCLAFLLAGTALAAFAPFLVRLVARSAGQHSTEARVALLVLALHLGSALGPWTAGSIAEGSGPAVAIAVCSGTLLLPTLAHQLGTVVFRVTPILRSILARG